MPDNGSAEGLGEPYWRRIQGLGGWVPIIDVMRASGLKNPGSAHNMANFLESRGREVRKHGNNPAWMRRKDLGLLPEWHLDQIKVRMRNSGLARQEFLESIDRPEFEDMDLVDIFDVLAHDFRSFLESYEETT